MHRKNNIQKAIKINLNEWLPNFTHFQFNVTLWQKIVVIFTLHLFGDLKS